MLQKLRGAYEIFAESAKAEFLSIKIDFVRKYADFIGFGYYCSEFKIYLESRFSYFKHNLEL